MTTVMDKVKYLEKQVRISYATGGFDLRSLEGLALQVLITRGMIEDKLKKGLSEKEKEDVNKALKQIKALERYIRFIYFTLGIKETKGTYQYPVGKHHFGEYIWKKQY